MSTQMQFVLLYTGFELFGRFVSNTFREKLLWSNVELNSIEIIGQKQQNYIRQWPGRNVPFPGRLFSYYVQTVGLRGNN